jgi:hypothetical protein
VIGYRNVLVGASVYDAVSGVAIFALPQQAPTLQAGRRVLLAGAGDFQEAKNVSTTGADVTPNTTVAQGRIRVVRRPTATWVFPEAGECVVSQGGRAQLLAIAGSTAAVRSVRFLDGRRTIATVKTGAAGLYTASWRTGPATKGRHQLRVLVRDADGRVVERRRTVRVCKQ